VVAKVRERLSVSKKGEKFGVETFNLKRSIALEVRKLIKISNRFAALENLTIVCT
jgi:hypothetical protein